MIQFVCRKKKVAKNSGVSASFACSVKHNRHSEPQTKELPQPTSRIVQNVAPEPHLAAKSSAADKAAAKTPKFEIASDEPQQARAMKFRFGNGDTPLDGFTIKRGVGVGGFGEVYFATNRAGKEVALKQIQRNLDVEVRGVRQCLNLKHPNLIALYDIQFDAQQQGWIVMEYVSGASLRDVLEANPHGLQQDELFRWFGQIAAGVAYLHDHGIVHRDLKPANIFEDEGIVKIGDYGLSKFISCSRRGGQTESVGTFHYMAPEIGKGEYGKEIDVYALGVMLYELTTGNIPFDGESSQEIIMKHLTADPDLSRVPAPIAEVVSKAMAKNPSSRFSSVRDMVKPLGMEVDDRYLLVRTKTDNLPPVVQASPERRIRESYPAQQYANQAYQQPAAHHAAPEIQPMAGGAAVQSPPRTGYAKAGQAGVKPNVKTPVAEVRYQEPIARSLHSGWLGLSRWWQELPMATGTKTALLIIAIVVLALNSGGFIPFVIIGMMLYIPYYCVWWILKSPAKGGTATPAARKRAVGDRPTVGPNPAYAANATRNAYQQPNRPRPVAANRPMSVKQWKVARRTQLAMAPRTSVWSEVTGSWLTSTIVVAVFSALAGLFLIGSGKAMQPQMMGIVWAATVALMTAWLSIGLGKRWQKEEGDWAIRSFTQLTFGFAVGAIAYFLGEFLMVPWESISEARDYDIPTHSWSGFFGPDQRPLLPAYLAYFPLLMGVIHWWKQVDPLRRVRFSFWSVLWSVIAASLVHLLIPFPQPWGALVAAGTSIAVQLSSPWINPNERYQYKQTSEMVA